jgi:hypothetical protein
MDPNSVIITRMQNLIFRYENAFFTKSSIIVLCIIVSLVALAFSIVAFAKFLTVADDAKDGEKASEFLTYIFPEYVNFTAS